MAAMAGGWRTETSPDGRLTMYVSPQGLRLSSSEFAQRYPLLKAYPESQWAARLHEALDVANEAAKSAPFGAGMAAGAGPQLPPPQIGLANTPPVTIEPPGPGFQSRFTPREYEAPQPQLPSQQTPALPYSTPSPPPPPFGRAPLPVPVPAPGAPAPTPGTPFPWGKTALGAGLAASGGAAYLAQRGQSGQTPQQQYGGMMDNSAQPGFDQWGGGQSEQPSATTPGAAPRGTGTERKNGYHAPTAAGGSVKPATQNVAFQPTGGGGVAANPNYYADMMNAADKGDAYANDQMQLVEQARKAAIEAQQRGDRFQFVPIKDYRNNRLQLVNANGADVVLDMNDPTHKAEYARMLDKIGLNPAELQAWSMRASKPLMRHFVPSGGHVDTTPDFAFSPRSPQVGQREQAVGGSAEPAAPQPQTIRSLVDGPAPATIAQPRHTIHSLDDLPPAPAQRPEPDADQAGGPSDQDTDNKAPSMSVGNYMSQFAPGDEELYRRLGKWNYDTEQPNTSVDRLQGALGADLNKRAAPKPMRAVARR